tara:strand:- start:914 stop:2908 length:1995 start_codon:yes stop_codon:yes gene_type:complete
MIAGQSDSLGTPLSQCWYLQTSVAKSGCAENQIDFTDILSDFGYSSPEGVPDDGWVVDLDDDGTPEGISPSACCDDTSAGGVFYPLIPKRYVIKFRDRGIHLSGAFWWSAAEASTGTIAGLRSPSIGSFLTPGSGDGSYCDFYDANYCTTAANGGFWTPESFGVKGFYNWSEEASPGYRDVEIGCDDCFPDALPSEFLPKTARVFWPCNQTHIDHEWEFEVLLDYVEQTAQGWAAVYKNTDMEWELGDITTDSVCVDPLAKNNSFTNASGWAGVTGSPPDSWCDWQTRATPLSGVTVEVPRNVTKIRGDGLKVSGKVSVRAFWNKPSSNGAIDPSDTCSMDFDMNENHASDGNPGLGMAGNRLDVATSGIQAYFAADDLSDFPLGTGPSATNGGGATWTEAKGLRQTCFADHQRAWVPPCDSAHWDGDFYCTYEGSCPNDPRDPGGWTFGLNQCFQTRFEIRPLVTRVNGAGDNAKCRFFGALLNDYGFPQTRVENGYRPLRDKFQRTYQQGADFGDQEWISGYEPNFGWMHEDHIPEPGVTSKPYGGSYGAMSKMLGEPLQSDPWYDNGCYDESGWDERDCGETTRVWKAMGGSADPWINVYPGKAWDSLTQNDRVATCVRVDGTQIASGFNDEYDADAEPSDSIGPEYIWSDHHIIFEPRWD